MALPAWQRKAVLLGALGVGCGASLLLSSRRESLGAPMRPGHDSLLCRVNLGGDKLYYHAGRFLRRFIDAESAHERAIDFASKSRAWRMMLGCVPAQYEWANLRTAPFEGRTTGPKTEDERNRGTKKARNHAGDIDTPLPLKSLEFVNPIGLAAGFDKNAQAIDGLLDIGFGFVEIGSVTPLPQPGNPRPRVFRLEEDRAIINRYGFNSQGMDAVDNHLDERTSQRALDGARGNYVVDGIVGVNLGKNKLTPEANAVEDYEKCLDRLQKYADYIVVNVSSPNTPGLRNLQAKSSLTDLLTRVKARRDALARSKIHAETPVAPPLMLKIAPDLTDEQKQDIADVCLNVGIDGLIISNTTLSRPSTLKSSNASEIGGLSGAPLKHMSTELIRDMHQRTKGSLVIIGVGGIENGEDVYAKIRAGANLIQVYSSFAYGGPHQVHLIKRELTQLLKRDGFNNVAEAVGADHRQTQKAQ